MLGSGRVVSIITWGSDTLRGLQSNLPECQIRGRIWRCEKCLVWFFPGLRISKKWKFKNQSPKCQIRGRIWHFEGSLATPLRVSDPRSDPTLWECLVWFFLGFAILRKWKFKKWDSKVSDPRSDLTLWGVSGQPLQSVGSDFFQGGTSPRVWSYNFFLRSGHWINDTCFWDSFLFEAEPCIMSLNVTLTFWMLSNLEGICPCHHHTEELCTNLRVSMLHHARLLHAFTVVHLVGENLAAIVCESWPRPMCLEEATAGRSQTLWLLVGVTVSWWLWNLEVEICI